jgi:hypothetical protein
MTRNPRVFFWGDPGWSHRYAQRNQVHLQHRLFRTACLFIFPERGHSRRLGTLAPEDTDLRLGERVELRREGIPDLGHADLLVGQSACSVKLGQEAGDEASTVVDVVLSVGSRQKPKSGQGKGVFIVG